VNRNVLAQKVVASDLLHLAESSVFDSARLTVPLVKGDGRPEGRARQGKASIKAAGGQARAMLNSHAIVVHCALLAFLALAPTAVLAQQGNPSQAQNEQKQVQPEVTQTKTEATQGQTEAQPTKDEDGKLISVPGGKALGMSILGNQEAPKALVIVPWKSSELGNVQGISTMLDDSRQPIDKEVFMRMLSYYEIRSETARPGSAPAGKTAAQPKTAAQRRK
jgi:hypothetical protein